MNKGFQLSRNISGKNCIVLITKHNVVRVTVEIELNDQGAMVGCFKSWAFYDSMGRRTSFTIEAGVTTYALAETISKKLRRSSFRGHHTMHLERYLRGTLNLGMYLDFSHPTMAE